LQSCVVLEMLVVQVFSSRSYLMHGLRATDQAATDSRRLATWAVCLVLPEPSL